MPSINILKICSLYYSGEMAIIMEFLTFPWVKSYNFCFLVGIESLKSKSSMHGGLKVAGGTILIVPQSMPILSL